MARKGRDFELAYEWLYDLNDKYNVTSPAFLYDKAADEKREVMKKLVESYDVDEVKVFMPSLNDIFVEYAGENV